MKKLVYTAFVAFWSIVLTVILLERLQSAAPKPVQTQEPAAETRYTLEQVARHATADDCWMAIEGGVYRLTDYLPRHPTASDVITEWCGREATRAMRTKGKSRDHSERAWRMLERYRIGTISGE